MVRTSLNDGMWRAFVSNDTKPSRSEKLAVRDTFYDIMAFGFSQDSHVSHDIRTGHLPNISKKSCRFIQPSPYLRIFPLRQKCESSNENLYAHNYHLSLFNWYLRL